MASTLFASRNDNHWGERTFYMRKNPRAASGAAATPIPTTTTSSSSNPNPNPRPYGTAILGLDNPNPKKHAGCDLAAFELSPPSEDCSSFSHQHSNHPSENGHVVFNVSSYSRKEVRDLKRRLVGELETVRNVVKWVESRDLRNRSETTATSSAGPARQRLLSTDPPKQKKLQVPRPSGNKRPPPPVVSPREAKRSGAFGPEAPMGESERLMSSMIRKCDQILTKLMKHKHGWVFNVPVDVVEMGLHDYNQIVKQPMDLGTVKYRLGNNLYTSPAEFAEDVRLTFNNALLYNPAGHDVYVMAEKLLRLFEELFGPAQERFEIERRAIGREQRTATHAPTDLSLLPPSSAHVPRAPPPPPPPSQPPVPPPQVPSRKPAMGKQPKPKAKDPNKREMSYEEKQKLSVGLESLPHEKMSQVLQIVRRKNPDPEVLTGGEIELDFETLSTETLWDLDRFVCNCKKNMSKMRRREAFTAAAPSPAVPVVSSTLANNFDDKAPELVGDTHESAAKKNRRAEQGEEDVDIGDEEMPSGHFPPVEIEKDVGQHESSSSDSSSDSSSSSSSSETDSRSSSDSESDGEAQSPAVGSRPSPQPQRGA